MRGSLDEWGGANAGKPRVYTGGDRRGRRSYLSRNFKRARCQAETALSMLVADVERSLATTNHGGSVGDLLTRWLTEIEPTRSPGTMPEHRRSGLRPPKSRVARPRPPRPSSVQRLVVAAQEEDPMLAVAIVAAVTGAHRWLTEPYPACQMGSRTPTLAWRPRPAREDTSTSCVTTRPPFPSPVGPAFSPSPQGSAAAAKEREPAGLLDAGSPTTTETEGAG